MMLRLRSCRKGQRPEGKEPQIACCTGDLFRTHEENWEDPGPVLPRISPKASTLSP